MHTNSLQELTFKGKLSSKFVRKYSEILRPDFLTVSNIPNFSFAKLGLTIICAGKLWQLF